MTNAIGWSIAICADGRFRLRLLDEFDEPFGELVMTDIADIVQFGYDLTNCVAELRRKIIN